MKCSFHRFIELSVTLYTNCDLMSCKKLTHSVILIVLLNIQPQAYSLTEISIEFGKYKFSDSNLQHFVQRRTY
jgi:hypothetical protein